LGAAGFSEGTALGDHQQRRREGTGGINNTTEEEGESFLPPGLRDAEKRRGLEISRKEKKGDLQSSGISEG